MSSIPILVAVERCQLCDRTRRKFTCRNCILEGNFYSSKKQNNGSFASKQKRLHIVCAVNNEYHSRLQKRLEDDQRYHVKWSQIVLLKSRIESLRKVIKEIKEHNSTETVNNEKFANELAEKINFIESLKTKIANLNQNAELEERRIRLQQCKEKIDRRKSQLKRLQLAHVRALVTYIFPITERKVYPEFGTPPRATALSKEAEDDVVSEVISAAEMELEDATRIIHVDGRWISQDDEERIHAIVGVGMPSFVDFIKYYEWLKSYRNEPRNNESQTGVHGNKLLSIPASLVYAAQLTDGLAYFLDVNLPNKIEYYDFSILKVSRKRVHKTVNNLAQNIMQLCFSQLVPHLELNPTEMLKNLKICVSPSNPNIGWCGSFTTGEYSLVEYVFDSDSSAEELNYNSSSDCGSSDPEEWDKLLDLPSEHSDIRSLTPLSSLETGRTRSLSTSASDLVTSAAISVASLWTWKR